MDPFLAGLIIITVVAYGVAFYYQPFLASSGIKTSLLTLAQSCLWIIVSIFFAGLLEQFLQKRFIYLHFGKHKGLFEILMGTLLGALGTGSRWAVYPLSVSLLNTGFSSAGVVAFISSWFLISLPRVGAEIPFLGAKFVFVRVIISLIVSVIAGGIARLWLK
ncbi:MAG: hypothetical protein JWN30_2022 [Bacilli bacterium]|nr:hypothetical protein [Bacilli bacterium]